MSFRLQIKGLENSKEIRQRIFDDLAKLMPSLLKNSPTDMNVVVTAEGSMDRYKCSINWNPKSKYGVHVEKIANGAYPSFKAAFEAVKEAARRQSGKRRKVLLGSC